nr:hypothetical protein [uncultured Devosia sp.]
MRTGHYTRLKGRVTYFRRKVPEFLQERLASTEICYRLGVISSSVAERLGRRLAVEVDTFFDQAKTDPMLDAASLTKLVETALVGWREDDSSEAAREITSYGRPLLTPKDQATAWAELASGLITRVGNGESAYGEIFVADIAEKAGIAALDRESAEGVGGRALSLGLAAHYLQSAINMASMHGLATGRAALKVEDWKARLVALETHLGLDGSGQTGHQLGQDAAPAVSRLSSAASTITTSDAPATLSIGGGLAVSVTPFSKLVGTYLKTRVENGEVKSGLETEMQSSLRIWVEVVGDRAIGEYDRKDFLKYRSTLLTVPKHYWKSDASRALSIHEVIDWARADARAAWMKSAPPEKREDPKSIERAASDYTKISNTTVNRHLSTISPVFEWATKNDHLAEDTRRFWANLHLPTGLSVTGLKPNEERPPFSHEQIRLIATHPVWLGRRSAYYYNFPGQVIIRDALYWGFPIALLHGMRREEFAQLKVKHIRQIDGIWIFDLHALDMDVKKGASRRYVPLHSQLIALGFLEAMVLGRKPDERLFAELSADGDFDRFGDAVGGQFARVLDQLGIVVIRKNGTKSEGCYHPLRHRFITDMLRAGVRDGLVDYITGQMSEKREGERARYGSDPEVTEAKAAIERLPVTVDFGAWVEAWSRFGR